MRLWMRTSQANGAAVRTLLGASLMLGCLVVPIKPAAAENAKSSRWNRERAAHLLRRAGFGASSEDVAKLEAMGIDRAVDWLVDYHQVPQTHQAFPESATAEPGEMKTKLDALSDDERRDVRQQLRSLNQANLEELRAWWALRMLQTPRPFEEKMTLFWHGHFTTGAEEVRATRLLVEQNELLRTHAVGSFRELLLAVCKDRAMLRYLNGDSNRKDHPNENFARELLELFTLGAGNYTERDITEAARAFTGWSVSAEGFRFRPGQHDFAEKTFLGRTGRFNGDDIVRIILEQPAAAKHLATRLLKFFVVDEPKPSLVDFVAGKLRSTDYNLRETMRALFKSESFYAREVMFEHVKSPPELVIGAARALGVTEPDGYLLANAMRTLGQDLFQPPNVKGWDGGRAWINSATLFARYDFAATLLAGTPEGAFDRRAKKFEELAHIKSELREQFGESMAVLRTQPRIANVRQAAVDAKALLREQPAWTNGEVLAAMIDRLLQRALSAEQRSTLLERLGEEGAAFDPSEPQAGRKLSELLRELMALPEFQVS